MPTVTAAQRRRFGAGVALANLALAPVATLAQDRPFVVGSGRIVSVDTAVYADVATAELVALARARHLGRALQLDGYEARIFTRLEGRVAGSRFARGVQLFAYETAAGLTWRQPGDVRVDVQGIRSTGVRIPGVAREGWATWWSEIFSDQLWFSPAALGDEIQLMGLPDEDALHPLARDAERFYRYAIVDSVTMGMTGRTVRALAVRVEPTTANPVLTRAELVSDGRHEGPDREPGEPAEEIMPRGLDSVAALVQSGAPITEGEIRGILEQDPSLNAETRIRVRRDRGPRTYSPTLVSGEMWLDADSLDVVRMMVTFVGDGVWDDDEDAPTLVSVEADLEYGLHEGRHWLPLRQVLAATFTYKYLPGAVLPATAVTTFSDYDLTPRPLAFDVDLAAGVTGRRLGAWRCPDPWEWDSRGDFAGCADQPYVKAGVEQNGTHWEISVPPLDSLLDYDFTTDFEHNVMLASNDFVEQRLTRLAGISEQVSPRTVQQSLVDIDWKTALGVFRFNRVEGPSLGFGATLDPGVAFTTVRVGGRFGFSDLRPTGWITWERDAPAGLFEVRAYRALQEREPWTDGTGVGNSLRALLLGHDEADYHLALGGAVHYRTRVGPGKDLSLTLAAERHRSVDAVAGSGANSVFFGSGVFPANPTVADGDYLRGSVVKEFFPGASRMAVAVEGWASAEALAGRVWGLVDARMAAGDVLARGRLKAGRAFGDRLPQSQFRAGGLETVRGYGYGTRAGDELWSAQLDLEWVVSRWWSPLAFGDVGNTSYATSPLVGIGVGASALSGWLRLELAKGINPGRPLRADAHFQIPLY